MKLFDEHQQKKAEIIRRFFFFSLKQVKIFLSSFYSVFFRFSFCDHAKKKEKSCENEKRYMKSLSISKQGLKELGINAH